jgi:hypothetical protein
LTDEQLAALYRVSAELADRGSREAKEKEEAFFERCRAKLDTGQVIEAGTEA